MSRRTHVAGPKCKGHSQRGKRPCGQAAVPGREYCRWHGGLAPASQNIRTGTYSKVPGLLAQAYQRAMADPLLLDQSRPIAWMEALAEDLATRIGEKDPPDLRRDASAILTQARNELAESRVADADKTMAKLQQLLIDGQECDTARTQLFAMQDRIGARKDSAWSIKLQRQHVMNAEDVATMLAIVLVRAKTKLGEGAGRVLAEIFEGLTAGGVPTVSGEITLAAVEEVGKNGGGGG